MIQRLLISVILLLGFSSLAGAQTVAADRFRLNTGPCVQRSGSGSPEGVQAGNICDEYIDNVTNDRYEKVAGAAGTNTGWRMQVGPSAAPCSTFENCVARELTFDFLSFTQRLRTDPEYAFQTTIDENGVYLDAIHPSGLRPLVLSGGPTRVSGGGLVLGSALTADPGFGNFQIDGFIGQPGFVSQTDGWRIDAAGGADFRYLFANEMVVKNFIADLEQALAGGQIITKSVTTLADTFTAPADSAAATLTVNDLPSAPGMAVFESGDTVRVRQFSRASGELTVTDAYGVVTDHVDNEDGTQDWTWTRIASCGAMTAGTEVAPDAIVLDYGVSGNGWYEVSAIDGAYSLNAPYAQVVTWSGDCPGEDATVRARLGNLRGITSVTGEYGLIAGTYGTGESPYMRFSTEAAEIHNADFAIFDSTDKVFEIDHTAPSLALGNPLPSGYSTGTGIWMGSDAGTYKARVGIPGGAGWFWNGSTFAIEGTVTAEDGEIGGWNIAATALTSGSGSTTVGLDSGGTNPAIYAGSATPGSAPFRVTNAGALTATSGTIGGWTLGATSLTSGSGTSTRGIDSGGTNPAFYAGSATPGSAPFRVTAAGALTSTSATITGAITASSGSITGTFSIGTGGNLRSGSATAFTTGTGLYTDLSSGNTRFRVGNPSGNRFLFDGSDIEIVADTVRIDDDGITLDAGGDDQNAYKFDDGSYYVSAGGNSIIKSSGVLTLDVSDITIFWPTTTAAEYPVVSNSSGDSFRKTNGLNGTTTCSGGQRVSSITVERGIVTAVVCS